MELVTGLVVWPDPNQPACLLSSEPLVLYCPPRDLKLDTASYYLCWLSQSFGSSYSWIQLVQLQVFSDPLCRKGILQLSIRLGCSSVHTFLTPNSPWLTLEDLAVGFLPQFTHRVSLLLMNHLQIWPFQTYGCIPCKPSLDSHLGQVWQDSIYSTLTLLLGHLPCTSDTDSTVSLPCGRHVDMMVYLFNSLYVLTLGKKWIIAFFSTITLAQFVTGMYIVGIAASKPGMWYIDWLLWAIMTCFVSCRNAIHTPSGLSPVHLCQVPPHWDGIHVIFSILQ